MSIIVMVLTIGVLVVQFNLGVKRKKILGAFIPIVCSIILILGYNMEKDISVLCSGIIGVIAIIIVWVIGRLKSSKYEKHEIDKMKTKDL